MFIYTVKASTVKFIALILAAVAAFVTIVVMSDNGKVRATKATIEANENVRYDKIKTEDDAAAFLEQFGWEVKTPASETAEIKLPAEFDKIMLTYNELQKSQGLDLHKYKGREVTRYTFEVTNYPDYDGTVLANVIVYKKRVIGGDVCSADVNGFITGFRAPQK